MGRVWLFCCFSAILMGFHNTYPLKAQTGHILSSVKPVTDKEGFQEKYTFYGQNPEDQFGRALCLNSNGSRVAMGSPFNDGSGEDAGQVQIFEKKTDRWVRLGKDILGTAAGDLFGSAVSLNAEGNRVAIGAPFNDGNGKNSGQVRVFELQNGDWMQLGEAITGEAGEDLFGSAVSLSANGHRLAIGALYNDGAGEDSGHVRVYEYRNGAWMPLGAEINGKSVGEQFGTAISLSAEGDRLVIGAPLNSDNTVFSGKVRIYGLQEDGGWAQLGNDIEGKIRFGAFGSSVSISSKGDRIAIGGLYGKTDGFGPIQIYDWNASDWVQMGVDVYGEPHGNMFGSTVSLSGNGEYIATAVSFSTGSGHKGNLGGKIYIYKIEKNGEPGLHRIVEGGGALGLFGWALNLSFDGNYVAVGAPFNNTTGLRSGQSQIVSLK